MVQFCYLRLYLGIKTVSCCQLLGWQGWTGIETWKRLGQPFEDQMPCV